MKFSIITCAYNSAKYVQKNIDSVKNQTFRDFEHIFIDAFSTDGTVEIIKKYHQEFPEKVKFFQYPPKGIADAMNEGIKKASGEYIIHLHSDDNFYDETILGDVAIFIEKNKNPDWIYGKANFINTETIENRIIPHRKIYHKTRFWLLLLTNYIPHQSVFLKKEIFDKFGMFEKNLKNLMDYDMWLRLARANVKSKFINKIICNFSVRPEAQSTTGKYSNEYLAVYKKIIKYKLVSKLLSFVYRNNQKRKFI